MENNIFIHAVRDDEENLTAILVAEEYADDVGIPMPYIYQVDYDGYVAAGFFYDSYDQMPDIWAMNVPLEDTLDIQDFCKGLSKIIFPGEVLEVVDYEEIKANEDYCYTNEKEKDLPN